MRATILLNLRSSRTQRHLGSLAGLFAARGIQVERLQTVADERELRRAVKRAVKAETRLLVVGGGDGSMTTAAGVLAHSRTILGVLPLGTGNSFALSLGIEDDVARAVDVIAAGRAVRVDLGCVNGTYFANFATVGLSAEIAQAAPHALKRVLGPAAYLAGAVAPFLKQQAFEARIRWDDGATELRTKQLVIANGRFFGRQPVVPDASIVDKRLALFTTSGVSNFEVARMYVAFGLGLQTRLPDAISFCARSIVLKTSPKQLISLDGNTLGKTPAHFSVAPRALRVYVPPEFDDSYR